MQGERDAQAGEDQGGGVGDRRLERGDGGQVAGGFGHPVLGGEADRGGRRGQDAQAGGGVAEPQAGAVVRRGGLAAVAGQGGERQAGRAGQDQDGAGRRRLAGSGAGEGDERKGHVRSAFGEGKLGGGASAVARFGPAGCCSGHPAGDGVKAAAGR